MGEGGSLVQRRRLPIPSRFFGDQQDLPLDRLPPCHARRHKGVADRIGAAPTDPERPGDLIEPEWRKTSERSEEHTSELQTLMSISYDVFCLKKTTHCRTLTIRYSTDNII